MNNMANPVTNLLPVFSMGGIIVITLVCLMLWFVLKRYQVVENNELMIIESWLIFRRKISFVSGGTKFVLPFFESYFKKSLEPMEINVDLNRVMTQGNIPLGGKIFAQVVIDDSEPNVYNVAKHLAMRTRANEIEYCHEILNGIVRETVANLTPEQVLEDKERFKEEMLKNAVVSLSHLGLKVKTLNVQEVSDEVPDGKGYIAQLMRPRMYQVSRDTRMEVSEAEAKKILAQNQAHLSMRLQQLDQAIQSLIAEMDYKIEQAVVEGDVKSREISAQLDAELQGILASLDTRKAELETRKNEYEADQIQKAQAKREQLVQEGKAEAVQVIQKGMAEIEVLKQKISMIQKAGSLGMDVFLVDNYQMLSEIFTDTIEAARAEKVSVLDGLPAVSGDSPFSASNVAALLEILKNSGVDISKFTGVKTEHQPVKR
ncbi:MAG: hypothetical protein JW774_09060 [Candidatus Aureabacteria bacterium]|nr:hypothetical protein [Candidatus Auribacterota bacterium]